MPSQVSFVAATPDALKMGVLKTATEIIISVERGGDLAGDCSVAVLFRGSDFYYPSAGGYDGIKINLTWNSGEGGAKQAKTRVIPTAEKLSYLDVELVDFLRCNPGNYTELAVAVHDSSVTPSWIPSTPGNYYQQIMVSSSGIRVETVPIPTGMAVSDMVGATATAAGQKGVVPVPPAGSQNKFLAGDATYKSLPVFMPSTSTMPGGTAGIITPPPIGSENYYFAGDGTWKPIQSSQSGLVSLNGVSNPGGDIQLTPKNGLTVSANPAAKSIEVGLPTASGNNQVLVWNAASQSYVPSTILYQVFSPSTLTASGSIGLVPAPPAGENNRFLSSDGAWKTVSSGISSIEQVSNAGGDVDFVGNNGIIVAGDNTTKKVNFSLPAGTQQNQTLLWNPTTQAYVPGNYPNYTGASLTLPGQAGLVPAPPAGTPNRYPGADGTWKTENTIPGQTGGTNGKIVRMTNSANTWTDAKNSDMVDELFGLAFKQNNEYFRPGAVIMGLSNLSPGTVYYLDNAGGLTPTVPTPSPTVRRVAVGKAISPETFLFTPGPVITG